MRLIRRPGVSRRELFETIAGQASVIDGDTIEIHGQCIRLFGIDAPESGQTCIRNAETYRCGKVAVFTLAKPGSRRMNVYKP